MKLGGDGVTEAPSPCRLSGAHRHGLWAEDGCWHEESESNEQDGELPKLQAIML